MSGNTIFHKIINREIPATIVFEDEQAIAIRDLHPVSPVHILIIPKKSIVNLSDATEGDSEILGHLLVLASRIAKSEGLTEDGYRVVINNGENAGQAVSQLHVHLLGGRSFRWPPG